MKLFGKGENDAEAEPPAKKAGGQNKLRAEIDRLTAQMEVVTQEREATGERFQHLAEEIGELRNMIIESQQQSKSLEAEAKKATELVGEVHPESMMADLKKEDAKIELLRAKTESSEALSANIVGQLKEMRRAVELFKGIDSLIKLSNEVKDDLRGIQRERAIIEKHSNNVENIFVEVQKRFSRFEKMSKEFDALNEAFREISGEFSGMKAKFSGLLSRSDISEIETGISNRIKDFDRMSADISDASRQVKTSLDENRAFWKRLEAYDKKFTKIDGRVVSLFALEREFRKIYGNTLKKEHPAGGILAGILQGLKETKKPPKKETVEDTPARKRPNRPKNRRMPSPETSA